MDELLKSIQKIIRQEIKQEVGNKIDNIENRLDNIENRLDNIENRLDNVENRLDNVESDIKDIKKSLFIIEHEHGKKIDAIYDLVNLDKEINKPKFDEISKITKKSEQNYLHILNHEGRISTLEKNTL